MMCKYEACFCRCGRIHLINNDKYDWLQEDYINRTIITVCQNCGATRRIWLDEYFDEGFAICSSDIDETEFVGDNCTQFIFSRGIRVPLVVGNYATSYYNNVWFDDNDAGKVDTARLIKEIRQYFKEEAEDILNSISSYVSGINWKGTPYDYEAKIARERR